MVISDKPEAGGLAHAKRHGVPNMSILLSEKLSGLERRREQESRVRDAIAKSGAELVVLSGYMRILTSDFVSRWKGRLVNIHPSLLPLFPGAHAHRDVLNAGEDISGRPQHISRRRRRHWADTSSADRARSRGRYYGFVEHAYQEGVKYALYPSVLDRLCSDPLSSISDGALRLINSDSGHGTMTDLRSSSCSLRAQPSSGLMPSSAEESHQRVERMESWICGNGDFDVPSRTFCSAG